MHADPKPHPNLAGLASLTLSLALTLQGSLSLTLSLTLSLSLSLQGARIVGFEVEPSSIRHTYSGAWKGGETSLSTCGGSTGSSPLAMDSAGEVVFTYDVKWEYSDIRWASRWDLYLYMGDDQVHWFSILNSLVIVLLLSGIVAMIMVRTLRRDLAEYNSVEEKDHFVFMI